MSDGQNNKIIKLKITFPVPFVREHLAEKGTGSMLAPNMYSSDFTRMLWLKTTSLFFRT